MRQRHWPYLLVAPYAIYIALFRALVVFFSNKIGVDILSSMVSTVVFVNLWLLYHFYHDRGKPTVDNIQLINE